VSGVANPNREFIMLGNIDAVATIAVRDLDVARTFYEGTLGLKPVPTGESGVLGYRSGRSAVMVYQSRFAGTNKATAATWVVGGALDAIVRGLEAKGVAFEHYDMPETTRDGAVHISGKTRVAWFKDPDGNILSIVNG
jgi:catechol 2,3-dioxygenase-like lactoylglutathione lyase family enzyme